MMNNGAGPIVMVRTELDALPVEEETGLPYASRLKTVYGGKESFVAHSANPRCQLRRSTPVALIKL